MDAGDADVEVVVVALDDGERVVTRVSLRVCEASTRASGRARGRGDDGGGSRMDAGDADVEVVLFALDDGERVLAAVPLRVREASTRASGRARGRGDDGRRSRMDAGDADVEGVGVALDDDRVVAAFSLRAALRRR